LDDKMCLYTIQFRIFDFIHPHLMAEVKYAWSCTFTLTYVFMTCCLIKLIQRFSFLAFGSKSLSLLDLDTSPNLRLLWTVIIFVLRTRENSCLTLKELIADDIRQDKSLNYLLLRNTSQKQRVIFCWSVSIV
jgi:hypothetical protein